MIMRAWVLRGIGDIRFEDVPMPVLIDGEELVSVRCAGICSSDIPRIYATGAYSYPLIPGHEFSGITGSGRRVAVFPLLPCFSCASCSRGEYETCSGYSYIGSRRDGAFAQYVAVPTFNLIDIPEDMDFDEAALLEPAAVALHAVRSVLGNACGIPCVLRDSRGMDPAALQQAGIRNAAVVGNGTIGRLIARWLEIYGIGDVLLLGRGDCVNHRDGATAGTSGPAAAFDVCFEAAGSIESLQRCISLTCPGGIIVLAGNPSPGFSMDRELYWQLLRRQITTHGIWNSRYPAGWQEAIRCAGKLGLKELISHRFVFEKAGEALEMMRSKKEKHIKVMIYSGDFT